MKKNLRFWVFLLCLVLFVTLFDTGIAYFGEELWRYSSYNDFDTTKAAHPEDVWDRVFFGNSAVVSAYREELSESGYVNLGLAYGVVTDLWEMLHQGHLKVGSELVVGLNLFALYDDLDTNPAYIWHRDPMEPYVYFHRDKLLRIGKDCLSMLLGRDVSSPGKLLSYGTMSQEELEQKVAEYQKTYFNLPIDDFQENLEALDRVADWCSDHGVRLRIVWMQFHPEVERPELMLELMDLVNDWCAKRSITVADFSDKLDKSCFYDVGHLNDEIGAVKFTEVIDPWLLG